jgi:hypothetical protein
MIDPLDDEEIEDEDEETYFGGPLAKEIKSNEPNRRTNKARAKKTNELVRKASKGNASRALRNKA